MLVYRKSVTGRISNGKAFTHDVIPAAILEKVGCLHCDRSNHSSNPLRKSEADTKWMLISLPKSQGDHKSPDQYIHILMRLLHV